MTAGAAAAGPDYDYRDGVIAELAESEYRLARDLAAVRQLLHLALEQLHATERQRDALREQNRGLRDRDERRAAA